ncbi:MAG: hypothetical protein LBV50_05985 [Novosphingobium sp.]|nr:hypothetical protein [Novosphingobium sp.]
MSALVLWAGAASAASPEQDYIALRDKAIARTAAMERAKTPIEQIDAENEKTLADLEKRLGDMLGPIAVKGFPQKGKIALETLNASDIDFGMLDGLRYFSDHDSPSLTVSTRGLTTRWLRSYPNLRLPVRIEDALKLDKFYADAIGSDVTFSKTLDLALETPGGADLAVARLGGWTQDVGPIYDQRIIVGVVVGDRVLIADAPAVPAVPRFSECDAVWAAANAEAEKHRTVYFDSKLQNQRAYAAVNVAWNKGNADYLACMARNLRADPSFPALLAQAQSLADRMAGR